MIINDIDVFREINVRIRFSIFFLSPAEYLTAFNKMNDSVSDKYILKIIIYK